MKSTHEIVRVVMAAIHGQPLPDNVAIDLDGVDCQLVRAGMIEALWWAESILRAQTVPTTRWHIAQKIAELEKL